MLLKYFYDKALAHASYLVACQRTKEAIVIDPARDIDEYLAAAQRENVRVTAAAETHIHADFVSGARELADREGAKLFLSDEGPPEWKYLFTRVYATQLLHDGDTFNIGQIEFQVLYTPGHTPESISFALTDRGGGATQPMGIFTGDFVFVGAVGRPDLLEEAAGVAGSADAGARQLFQSLRRFEQLPDFVQIWPAHGAGSACGKGLGAVPSSTVGYEKLFNPAFQIDDEAAFIQYILSEQPEVPPYFAVMKRVNKQGPALVGDRGLPPALDVATLPQTARAQAVIDIAPSPVFARAHVPGVINIPAGMLAQWAGWLVDVEQPLYLVADPSQLAEATRVLRKIGVDQLIGYFAREAVERSGLATESYSTLTPTDLQSELARSSATLVDVRSMAEWNDERIAAARHIFLGKLPRHAREFAGRRVAVHCLAGGRSAIAASVLQAAGAEVINMQGGITAWKQSGRPTETGCSR
jgi:hydroxyacylglutathione hydrolase